jgi:hypothetical protein
MTETVAPPLEPPRRFHFGWLFPALFRPRSTFATIASQTSDVWLTPLLVLMLTAMLNVIAAGPIKQAAALGGSPTLPPGFEFYTPEQQAQFFQAAQATQGPVFVYVFPAIISALSVWVGWLIVVGLLHLVLTLLGGRGSARSAMNVVAWASLPFAVRDLLRIGFMIATQRLVGHPGLSGFAPADGGGVSLFLSGMLGLFDVYLIWHIILLVLGARHTDNLAMGKTTAGVTVTILAMMLLQTVPGFIAAQFQELNIIRPFF